MKIISKRCSNVFRFSNQFMEHSYQKAQQALDAKLFLIFGIVILLGTTLNLVLSLLYTDSLQKEDIIILAIEVTLPFVGLIIRKKWSTLSKILTILALPLVMVGFKNLLSSYYEPSQKQPVEYFAFGNSFGVVEVALTISIKKLEYKMLLSIGLLISKLIALKEGYEQPNNWMGATAAVILLILSFVYQEILARRDYKAIFESQERLRKFKSLLSDDFPIGVLIMTSDFSSILYSNLFFQQSFEGEESKVINSVFNHFELEIDLSSSEISSSLNTGPLSLATFLQNFESYKIKSSNQNLLVLPATYREANSDNLFHYEIKLRKTTWDGLTSYAMIFNDVSQKQMVTALKLADKQKDRIIATVSHELRTPINGTLGLLEMITERVSDELSQTYLKYCKACNKLLLYLVNSILDLSQLQQNTLQINKESFVLEELLEELRALYLYQCQMKGIKFVIEKGEYVPKEIYTDRHRLIEILINLVGNAIKFTFKGSVTLKIELDDKDFRKLKFHIIDTGIGIQEGDKDKLFKRFGKLQQQDSNINVQGAGLGLAIVQDLVQALNDDDKTDKVDLKSEYGTGSTFSFRLSFMREFARRKSAKKKSTLGSFISPQEYDKNTEQLCEKIKKYEIMTLINPSQFSLLLNYRFSGKNMKKSKNEIAHTLKEDGEQVAFKQFATKNILIVDDNPFNILAASYILEKFNCKIDKAFNGQECIELLQQNTEQEKYYDLILMDIQMPVLGGPEASKIIKDKIQKGEFRDVPIVALTAKKSTAEERKYYRECGILTVLEKPLDQTKLAEAVGVFAHNNEPSILMV